MIRSLQVFVLASTLTATGLVLGCETFPAGGPKPSQSSPVTKSETPVLHDQSARPEVTQQEPVGGEGTAPAVSGGLTPPGWYWQERQSQELERQLEQQRSQYYLNRRQAPQFQRPLNCQSYMVGGQVYTTCN